MQARSAAGPRRVEYDELLEFFDDPDEFDDPDDAELLPDEAEEYVQPPGDPEEELLTSP